MDSAAVFFTPLALLLALAWNFAVLASVQLTVRLIRGFSLRRTLVATVALSVASVPFTAVYYELLGRAIVWLPAMMGLIGLVGFVVARRVMLIRRRRGAVAAAVGVGILSAPWGAFLVR